MQLTECNEGYRLRFGNGIVACIRRSGDVFRGIGQVMLRRRKLRSERLPILPLIDTPDGHRVTELHVRDIRQEDEAVTISLTPHFSLSGRTEWLCCDGQDRWVPGPWDGSPVRDRGGTLSIDLRAVETDIGGIPFVGFSYGYKFRSRKHRAYRIHDRATWELGGWATANSFWMRGPFNELQKDFRNKNDAFTTAWRAPGGGVLQQFLPLFAVLQGFTFQFDKRALLVTAFEEPFACRSLFEKRAGENHMVHWHQLCGDLSGCLEFPALQVLCAQTEGSPEQRADQYCAVRDGLQRRFAESQGLGREAGATGWQMAADDEPRAEDLRRALGDLAQMACERLYVPSLEICLGPRARSQRTDAPQQEARDRLGRFVADAHRRGLEVAAGIGDCCQPWLMGDADSPSEGTDGDATELPAGQELVALALRDVEARKALLEHLRGLKTDVGIDVLFADNFLGGVADPFNWSAPTLTGDGPRQAAGARTRAGRRRASASEMVRSLDAERVSLVADLQRIGYRCAVSGAGGLAPLEPVPAVDLLYGREYMFRDCVLGFPLAAFAESDVDLLDAYFRGCAHRVGYAVLFPIDREKRPPFGAALHRGLGSVNKACHAVREHMEHSRVLADDRGVLWQSAEPDVLALWAFSSFAWKVGDDAKVFDVMAGRPVETDSGRFRPLHHRVYLVQDGAEP